jgi:hypothetical protein
MRPPMSASQFPAVYLSRVFRRLPRARAGLGLVAVVACATFAPPTNVHILHTTPSDRSLQEPGTSLPLTRSEVTLSHEGLKRGYFVIKSDLEWHDLWPTLDADKVPVLPHDFDFGREMLLVASPPGADATGSELKAAILNDREVHAYVTETVLGTDCPSVGDSASKSYDVARVQRIDDKDVTFHVDSESGEACGEPPDATVACKPDHSSAPLVEKLSVEPATKVACLVSEVKTSRPVVDFTWTWDSMPVGSAAKIDVAHGARAATFIPEAIGTYRLLLELSDDLARKRSVPVDVKVPPPAAPLSLQMVWTKMDANDDPATFPRIELHAFGVTPEMPRAGSPPPPAPSVPWGGVRDCSISAPLRSCTAKTAGSTTVMTLDPSSSKGFALAVRYVDERVPGQPVVCVRSYRDGKAQADRCDTLQRAAGAWWNVGVIDTRTGKTMEMIAEELTRAAHSPSPDGGTVDGGVAGRAAPPDGAVADSSKP